MELIESTFSGTSDRVEQDAEAQKRAAAQALQNAENQRKSMKARSSSASVKESEEQAGSSVVDKTASTSNLQQDRSVSGAQEGVAKSSSGTQDDDTPQKLPVAKAPEVPLRPPLTPRKNVIPSRRASFDTARASSSPRHSEAPGDNAQAENAAKQSSASVPAAESAARVDKPAAPVFPQPDESPALEANRPQVQPPDMADQPTRTALPAASGDSRASAQTANPAPAYHDTSAAEMAWQAVDLDNELPEQDTRILASAAQQWQEDEQTTAESAQRAATAAIETRKMAVPVTPAPSTAARTDASAEFIDLPTTPLPVLALAPARPPEQKKSQLSRKKALLMAVLLAILALNATATGFSQAFGAQGWASVWNNQAGSNQNLLTQIAQQLLHSPTPGGVRSTATPPPTPTQIVNLLMSNMTLDEKLGQMMMVQFTGPDYSPQLDAMISQYKVGSVLVFAANGNIVSKPQLKGLISQMQKNAFLPLAISIDQEGGTVDRLINLDGPQPAAATIGASGDPHKAYEQGIKDAQDLAYYGFNLNLAPVVDVTNVYNPQLYDRTYGNTAALVTSMAGAYLQGLQKSGQVMGTLKHFPGLGDVSVDPHYRPPDLTRSLNSLDSIDWAPYSNLIKQGDVYAIMVTHEYVKALDTQEPSSLSPQVIGILRKQMHFQGVIMTDSLTMDSISNYYSYGQAAAMAVEAGDDLLMGASSVNDLVSMINGIKQAITAGTISQQQIDDSVRRILLLKYEMGLIHV